jgi:acetoin:2,6-dichlorophenolindophenol oxidoreductase subunit alpha
MSLTLPTPIDDTPVGPPPHDLDRADLLALYRAMVGVREFEVEVVAAFRRGQIPGSTHPCIGQEATKVGAIAAIDQRDLVLATYRGHAEALLKGLDPVGVMAELMGRQTGVNGGKGGSMHLADPSRGLITTNAIVSGHIPHAGGVALSCQYRRSGQVVVCFFGDGASCEGEFFETLNMAMIWKVPLIFVCENNGYAISVPVAKSQATPDIADRARGFGMPAAVVDGTDVIAVRAAVADAAVRARSGAGPSFVECKTIRWEHHSGFSSGNTRDADARRLARERVDPIDRLRRSLTAWGMATADELAAIDADERQQVQRVTAEAQRAPMTGPESIMDHIYA